jgi:hypothetical protein
VNHGPRWGVPILIALSLSCASASPAKQAVPPPPPETKAPPASRERFAPGSRCRKARKDDVCRPGYKLVCDEGIGILRCQKQEED